MRVVVARKSDGDGHRHRAAEGARTLEEDENEAHSGDDFAPHVRRVEGALDVGDVRVRVGDGGRARSGVTGHDEDSALD